MHRRLWRHIIRWVYCEWSRVKGRKRRYFPTVTSLVLLMSSWVSWVSKHTNCKSHYLWPLDPCVPPPVAGKRVKLQGFNQFLGGLDNEKDLTGEYSVFTEFQGLDVMFHVSTLMPFSPNDPQQARHLVTIIVSSPPCDHYPNIYGKHSAYVNFHVWYWSLWLWAQNLAILPASRPSCPLVV